MVGHINCDSCSTIIAVPIPPRPDDTTREAERVQAALIRAAPVARRLRLAFGLSATVIGLAKRAIARANPAESNEEIELRFVAFHYGRDLADSVKDELQRRRAVLQR